MYTKKHFENMAKFVKNSTLENKESLAFELVSLFKADNSKFKPEKFLKACGLIQLQPEILKNSTMAYVESIYSLLDSPILKLDTPKSNILEQPNAKQKNPAISGNNEKNVKSEVA